MGENNVIKIPGLCPRILSRKIRSFYERRNFMERDMTVGTPWKIILNFTIPIVIGNIFQQFYSMVDTVIVGKFVGTKAQKLSARPERSSF